MASYLCRSTLLILSRVSIDLVMHITITSLNVPGLLNSINAEITKKKVNHLHAPPKLIVSPLKSEENRIMTKTIKISTSNGNLAPTLAGNPILLAQFSRGIVKCLFSL